MPVIGGVICFTSQHGDLPVPHAPAADPFAATAFPLSLTDTINMLKNAQLAIGWALEHLPEELFAFFTEWKAHEDEYVWVTNMTGWIEEVRVRKDLAAENTGGTSS
jgi:hypothetical protein